MSAIPLLHHAEAMRMQPDAVQQVGKLPSWIGFIKTSQVQVTDLGHAMLDACICYRVSNVIPCVQDDWWM